MDSAIKMRRHNEVKLRHYVNKLCLDVDFDEYIIIICNFGGRIVSNVEVIKRGLRAHFGSQGARKNPYLNRVYAMH